MCKARRMMQMMQWSGAVLSLGLFLCMGGLQGVAAAAEKAPIHWRLQSVFPATSLANTLAKNFCDDVKKRTNGRVEVELFYAGALAKPLETFDAVAAGSVDLAVSGGVYHTRKVPEALFEFGLSYSFQNQDQAYGALP